MGLPATCQASDRNEVTSSGALAPLLRHTSSHLNRRRFTRLQNASLLDLRAVEPLLEADYPGLFLRSVVHDLIKAPVKKHFELLGNLSLRLRCLCRLYLHHGPGKLSKPSFSQGGISFAKAATRSSSQPDITPFVGIPNLGLMRVLHRPL